jgi:exodeoxyribonuclease V alpha subunit
MITSFGTNPIRDIRILIPSYKTEVGIHSINKLIQDKSSSASYEFYGKSFKVGDKVVQTKNDYEKELRNGNIGIVEHLSQEKMVVKFDDDRKVEFDSTGEDTKNLDLAHVLSVHKSQGSEYLVAIVVVTTSHSFMLSRKLLYTAVTRVYCCYTGQAQGNCDW